MKYKAVIFDMDGLLIDSERIALDAFVEACREHNFEPDLNVYFQLIGGNSATDDEVLIKGYGRDFPVQSVSALWKAKFVSTISNRPVPLKPGALGLVRQLKKSGVKQAVVTSTEREQAMKNLTSTHMLNYFDFVLCREDVQHRKPDPEIFRLACRKFGEEPADCLALEDSNNGVLSAHRAGLSVIQIPDLLEPTPEVRSLGHEIKKSLVDVRRMLG